MYLSSGQFCVAFSHPSSTRSNLHTTLRPAQGPLQSPAYAEPTGESGPGQYLAAPLLTCPQSSSSYSTIERAYKKKKKVYGPKFYYSWFPQQLAQLSDNHFSLSDSTIRYSNWAILKTRSPSPRFVQLNSVAQALFFFSTQQAGILLDWPHPLAAAGEPPHNSGEPPPN